MHYDGTNSRQCLHIFARSRNCRELIAIECIALICPVERNERHMITYANTNSFCPVNEDFFKARRNRHLCRHDYIVTQSERVPMCSTAKPTTLRVG